MQPEFTPTEQKFYDALKASSNGVMRTDLIELCKSPKRSNVVDAHRRNMRRKMKNSNETIVSLRGVGYKLMVKEK